jgi:hypothetical protein
MTPHESIAAMLHQNRNTWTLNNVSELTDAALAATGLDCKLALLRYCADLLKATEQVTRLELASAEHDVTTGGHCNEA